MFFCLHLMSFIFSSEIYHLVKSFAGLYYREFGGCSYLKDEMLHSAVAKGIIIGDSDNNENNDVDHTCHHRTKQTNGPQPPPPLDAKDSIFQNVLMNNQYVLI